MKSNPITDTGISARLLARTLSRTPATKRAAYHDRVIVVTATKSDPAFS
jgi:hypothetical protein